MRSVLRQFRRAPGRITASIFALALAVGAIGVLAIPTVSEGTLHEAVERDGLGDIIVDTTPLDAASLDRLRTIDGVTAVDGEIDVGVRLADGSLTRLIGLDIGRQQMDRLQIVAGRLPGGGREVVTSASLGSIGDDLIVDGQPWEIVGHGTTLSWSDIDAVYADLDAVRDRVADGGTNRLVITAADDGIDHLRSVAEDVRAVLAADGGGFADFPLYLPDGSSPIDADIEQISTLIALLGLVAGAVALVLLASTTNTLITERTREVAVMRAMGGRSRQLRRRLRRIAMTITAVALVIGVPLGVLISNVIARMVLEEFVGITPAIGVDWFVIVGSVVGTLLGARLVAARAARRVTRLPLAEALRDRDGAPFGRRWFHRVLSRVPVGGLLGRLAARAGAHRPARTSAVVAQVAAGVGAAFLIASLTTSVNTFNSAVNAPWSWESMTIARDPGLPFPQSIVDDDADAEAGVLVTGEIEGWEVDIYGLQRDTRLFDPMIREGTWISSGAGEAVVSAGFAARNQIEVGDVVTVGLAGGPIDVEVVGTSDDFGRALYIEVGELAAALGAPGSANVVWSTDAEPSVAFPVAARTSTAADLAADDAAGRDAIVLIFGAIGVVVAGVAALAVVSSMSVSLFERRHELATMQALGGRRRRLRGVVARELMAIGAGGVVLGLGLGSLGTRGIIGSFEASNAVDIGVVDAVGAIPVIVAATFAGLLLLTRVVVRSAALRPVAVTLRSAA